MKIFDCFTFFNELELLEFRLKILSPYVDYFILVESNITFRGNEKPFYFNPNYSIFQPYIHKIIHLKYENKPQITKPNDYSLEIQQRNYITKGLEQSNVCQENDIIIIADLDEIPNPDILKQLKTNSILAKNNLLKLHRIFRKNNSKLKSYYKYFLLLNKYYSNSSIIDILNITPISLYQNYYYYYVNYLHPDKWCGSVISFYKNMKTPQKLRDLRRRLPIIKNGGWHFAYMGGISRIKKKVNSTVDENSNRNINKIYSEEYIKKCLKNGSLIYDYQNQNSHVFTKVSIESLQIPNIKEFIKKYPDFYLE